MISRAKLDETQSIMYDFIIYMSYGLLLLTTLGISETAPKYLAKLDIYIRIYVCLFLIWRFNPLSKKYKFTDLDRKIAFSAGFFILTTTAINQYVLNFKEIVKNLL